MNGQAPRSHEVVMSRPAAWLVSAIAAICTALFLFAAVLTTAGPSYAALLA
jgi:hypothetical protein